jgi:ligand-binding SRPBCC domain-containing protein
MLMPIHTLQRKLVIPTTRGEAWEFFSDPRNLSKITPAELGFRTVTPGLPAHVYPGLMIEHRVSPMFGVPISWLTEITQVREGEFFVDEQRVGPYAIWHHEHHFRDAPGGGVEMEDRITYALPWGWIGNFVHPLVVRPQLERIFAHREQAVRRIFPG